MIKLVQTCSNLYKFVKGTSKLVQIYQELIFLTDVTDEMIQMPSGPGGDSPAQNAESIKIEEHNPPQVNLQKCQKQQKKQPKDFTMQ